MGHEIRKIRKVKITKGTTYFTRFTHCGLGLSDWFGFWIVPTARATHHSKKKEDEDQRAQFVERTSSTVGIMVLENESNSKLQREGPSEGRVHFGAQLQPEDRLKNRRRHD